MFVDWLPLIFTLIVFLLIYTRFLSPLIITFKIHHEDAKYPTQAYDKAACWDVYSITDSSIPPGEWREFRTGVSYAPWPHFYIKSMNRSFTPFGNVAYKIHSRSGIETKQGTRARLGIMDNDYRGELTVWLFNHSNNYRRFHVGDKIAQVEFYRVPKSYMVEVDELSDSFRGDSGFGSSGK